VSAAFALMLRALLRARDKHVLCVSRRVETTRRDTSRVRRVTTFPVRNCMGYTAWRHV